MKMSFSRAAAMPLLIAASMSAAAATPPKPAGAAAANHSGANGRTPGTLNIVWHGTFAFVPGDDKIEVLIPYAMEHVYRAGTFLEESDLAGNDEEYTLNFHGNPGATGDFSPAENICVRGIPLERSPAVLSKWILPRPDAIYSMRCERITARCFSGKDARLVKHLMKVAELQVFSYRIDDLGSLSVAKASGGTIPWVPAIKRPIDGRSLPTVNLHVFADPPTSLVSSNHVTMAFDQLARLVPGLDLHFNWEPQKQVPVGRDPMVPGLEDSRELWTLAERSRLLPTTRASASQPGASSCTTDRRSIPHRFNPLAGLTSQYTLGFAEDGETDLIRVCTATHTCTTIVIRPPSPPKPPPPKQGPRR